MQYRSSNILGEIETTWILMFPVLDIDHLHACSCPTSIPSVIFSLALVGNFSMSLLHYSVCAERTFFFCICMTVAHRAAFFMQVCEIQ
jgi:hypothetical protein